MILTPEQYAQTKLVIASKLFIANGDWLFADIENLYDTIDGLAAYGKVARRMSARALFGDTAEPELVSEYSKSREPVARWIEEQPHRAQT